MAMLVRNEKAYHRIVGRQYRTKWGSDYDPSIRATPKEAPGSSTASTLMSESMGRLVHVLSRNELKVALIALYNPAVWYIREQQMLFWDDHQHFLHGHPKSGSQSWPAFRGTWQVACDMGFRKMHPMVRVYSPRHGCRVTVPFPYLGDLLLCLSDTAGTYAVNITVKDKMQDFRRPFSLLGAKTPAEREHSAIARHTIERVAYESAGTRTEQVAGQLIPKTPFENLRFLFVQNRLVRRLSTEQISAGIEIANRVLPREMSPIAIGDKIDREVGCRGGAGVAIVWHGIWTRAVRACLYHNILPDRPIIPETRDVLVEFAHWFRR